jgi:hypothetical protein
MEGITAMKACPVCGAVIDGTGDARSVGRPRKYSVDDLAGCLLARSLATAEFRKRAADTLDISKSCFYRLLEQGRREYRFRQHGVTGEWKLLFLNSQNTTKATNALPNSIGEMADKALHE